MDSEKLLSDEERRALIESLPTMRPKPAGNDKLGELQWQRRYGEFDRLIGMTLNAVSADFSMEYEALQLALVALVDKHKAEASRMKSDRRHALDPDWLMAERAAEMVRTSGAA